MARLLVAGVAWIAAVGLFAALIEWSVRSARPTPTPPAVTDLVRALNKMESRPAIARREPWIVTRAMSAQRAMVIDVEADKPETAKQIATELIAPLRSKYDEVLIYVRPTGNPVNAVVRRIQWTPHDGFIESTY